MDKAFKNDDARFSFRKEMTENAPALVSAATMVDQITGVNHIVLYSLAGGPSTIAITPMLLPDGKVAVSE